MPPPKPLNYAFVFTLPVNTGTSKANILLQVSSPAYAGRSRINPHEAPMPRSQLQVSGLELGGSFLSPSSGALIVQSRVMRNGDLLKCLSPPNLVPLLKLILIFGDFFDL